MVIFHSYFDSLPEGNGMFTTYDLDRNWIAQVLSFSELAPGETGTVRFSSAGRAAVAAGARCRRAEMEQQWRVRLYLYIVDIYE